MDKDRYSRIVAIYQQVRDVAPAQQRERIAELCGDDDAVRDEVLAMLSAASRAADAFPTDTSPEERQRRFSRFLSRSKEILRPEKIGPYRILSTIGHGGMGVVYLAEQQNPNRTVAVKVLRPGLSGETSLRRFQYEVEILGSLQHPGIAQIYDAGTADTGAGLQPYFVMEWVRGKPLTQYVDEAASTLKDRIELFIELCRAVHYAHQKGVIHRDIKPSNILVDQDGRPKVLDFGVAKSTNREFGSDSETHAGELLGTVPYMSPEQISTQRGPLDTRTDVYSLGVVLYELLTGQLPYAIAGKSLPDAIRVVCEGVAVPLGATHRALRGDLETIVGRALDKDPNRRYPSASELAADLRRYLDHSPISARPPTIVYSLRRFARRHSGFVAAGIAVFLSLISGVMIYRNLLAESRASEARAIHAAWLAKEAERAARQAEAIAKQECNKAVVASAPGHLLSLVREAKDLWPRRDNKLPEMDDWMRSAEELIGRVPVMKAFLEDVAKSPSTLTESDPSGTRRIIDDTKQLLIDLDRFRDERTGLLADVQRRIDFANKVRHTTVEEASQQWEEAILDICLSEEYGGIEIEPIVGLVPLGKDPDSGLWEFLHVESGQAPVRDPDTDQLCIMEETGLVLVLVPGGTYGVGSQDPDSGLLFPDAERYPNEFLHRVTLDPFLISKYEMTQSQWERLTGHNPSFFGPDFDLAADQAPVRPVEQLSFETTRATLLRYALVLPTEAQWEVAARAGTTTPWWCGPLSSDLIGNANVADRSAWSLAEAWGTEDWNDGFPITAPVASFAPNDFGLHDVIGNVWEWCLDATDYRIDQPLRDGDGLREIADRPLAMRVCRGGSFRNFARDCRSAMRNVTSPAGLFGVRPAMVLPSRPVR